MPGPDPAAPDPWLDRPAWAPAWLPTVDDARSVRWMRWVIGALFVAGLGACVLRGADSPADPEVIQDPTSTTGDAGAADAAVSTTAPPPSDDVRGLAAAFGAVTAELVDTSGAVHVLCLLHADDADERSQGLMGVTDLTGADGMLFSHPAPTTGSFYMYRTLLPLTVGFWDGTGSYVGQADMVPCESEDPDDCRRYPPPGDPPQEYVFAIEVVAGDPLADALPGSRIAIGSACTI